MPKLKPTSFDSWTDTSLNTSACQIELTEQCNHKCLHCYNAAVNKKAQHINTALVLRILDFYTETNVLQLTFSGGEPLLHPDFLQIYRYAKKKGFLISLLTNGTVGNKRILQVLKKLPPETLGVSLYSMDPVIHDAITGVVGSHKKTLLFLQEFKKAQFRVFIQYVHMQQNEHTDLRELKKYCRSNGFQLRTSYVFESTNKENKKIESCFSDTLKVSEKEYEFSPDEQKIDLANKAFACKAGSRSWVIDAHARLYPCILLRGDTRWKLSSKNIPGVFAAFILNMQTVREKTLRPRACVHCKYRPFCAWCPGKSFCETGKYNQRIARICNLAEKNYAQYNIECSKLQRNT